MKILNVKIKTSLAGVDYITSKLYLLKDKQNNFILIPARYLYKYDDYKIICLCFVHHPEIMLGSYEEILQDWSNQLKDRLLKGVDYNKLLII